MVVNAFLSINLNANGQHANNCFGKCVQECGHSSVQPTATDHNSSASQYDVRYHDAQSRGPTRRSVGTDKNGDCCWVYENYLSGIFLLVSVHEKETGHVENPNHLHFKVVDTDICATWQFYCCYRIIVIEIFCDCIRHRKSMHSLMGHAYCGKRNIYIFNKMNSLPILIFLVFLFQII